MALIICPKCGKKISDKAPYCPGCGYSSTTNHANTNVRSVSVSFTNEQILLAVKPSVCSQLKSPASAQFPMDVITITGNSDTGYHIDGFVDSQNGYGAMIRNDFTAEVKVVNGALKVISCSVGVKTTQENASAFLQNWLFYLILTGLGGLILYFFISASVGL